MASVFGSVTGPGFWHAECHVHQQAAALGAAVHRYKLPALKMLEVFVCLKTELMVSLGFSFACIRKDQLDEHRSGAIFFFFLLDLWPQIHFALNSP